MHRSCIDREYIEKLLAEISEALDELRSIVSRPLAEVLSSRDLRYAMRFSVVLLVEALTDAAQHILVRCFSIEPKSYVDALKKLVEVSIVRKELADRLAALARLRNIIVHRYWEIDDLRIYNEAKTNGIAVVESTMSDLKRWLADA